MNMTIQQVINLIKAEKEAIKFLRSKGKEIPSIEDTLDEILRVLNK